jgi:hypothetical protein
LDVVVVTLNASATYLTDGAKQIEAEANQE